jgi:hypothetical protein
MVAIYFIESKGIKYYKADTFWSKTKDYTYAKEHDDTKIDQDRFLESLLYSQNSLSDGIVAQTLSVDFYNNSIYGYQTLDKNKMILDTHYLKLIKLDGDKYKANDYRQIIRDEKIKNILS